MSDMAYAVRDCCYLRGMPTAASDCAYLHLNMLFASRQDDSAQADCRAALGWHAPHWCMKA